VLWNQVLLISSELNEYEIVLSESEKAIELFPSQPTFYLFKGIAQTQRKKHAEAIETLNNGLIYVFDNKPLSAQFYATLGDAYNAVKNYALSDSSYEQSLTFEPNNVYVLNNYSYYLSVRKENLERAKQLAEKCNKLEPNSPSFLDTYAWVLFQMEDYENAKIYLEKAIEKGGSNNPVINEHLGDTHFKLGNTDKALEYWEKANELSKEPSELLRLKIEKKTLIVE
jgi:tetratricopeptide (TPR) repeat protein